MFVRHRKKPIPLQRLDALIPRLPSHHSKMSTLNKRAASYQKGFNGEKKLDYHLGGMHKQFSILNDVTLQVFHKKVQIDSLLISPHGIYLIEVKSLDGTITFDTILRQLTQQTGEKINGYKYPITQVERIQFHLLRWLQKRHLNGLPIYYFIVFSEQSTIINVKGDQDAVRKAVSYVDEVPLRIMNLDKRLTEKRIANNDLKDRIIRKIMHESIEFDYDTLQKFGLHKSEILPGVLCTKCRKLKMNHRNSNWHCNFCGASSKNAHIATLSDYFLLFNNTITNKQGRYFLQTDCRHLIKKFFKSSNLTLIRGTQKWTL